MLADKHPVSLFYRLERQVRRRLERLAPVWFISRYTRIRSGRRSLCDQHIVKRLEDFSASVPFSNADFSALFDDISNASNELIRCADAICDHRFDLLGSGIVEFGPSIPWHWDFVTGFEWDVERLYSDVRAATPPGSDIKRPWELSRCQHFITLGLAWKIIQCEKYKIEYIAQLTDWIEKNPVGYGVNWVCPMDVAFRAVNWLAAFALMSEGLLDDDHKDFRRVLTASLWEHGRFIRSHLEWNGSYSPSRANHFLSDLTGLYTLGCFFKDTGVGKEWLSFSHRNLEREMQHQVLPDGVHFERSISYHRMCLELFLWCRSLGRSQGCVFTDSYGKHLYMMQDYVHAYIRPDHMAPLIGDNDDGRLLSSGLVHLNDHRYLCGAVAGDISSVDSVLLTGEILNISKDWNGWCSFGFGGFHIYKDNGIYLIVRAGPLAHNGAHAHCDQLSFELCLHGEPIFVDRGTYVYTSDIEMRNKYRGTRAHNTLVVNEEDQNRTSGVAFGFHDDTQTEVLKSAAKGFKALHRGFVTTAHPERTHTRSFEVFENGSIEIVDGVSSVEKGDRLVWHFHLAPGLDVESDGKVLWIRKGTERICSMEIPAPLKFCKERFEHSPSYGVLQEAYVLVFEATLKYDADLYETRFMIIG